MLDTYQALNKTQLFFIFVVIVMPHPHFQDGSILFQDITILDLEYRTIILFVVFLKKHVYNTTFTKILPILFSLCHSSIHAYSLGLYGNVSRVLTIHLWVIKIYWNSFYSTHVKHLYGRMFCQVIWKISDIITGNLRFQRVNISTKISFRVHIQCSTQFSF